MVSYTEEELVRVQRETDLPAMFRAKGARLEPTEDGGFNGLCLFHTEEAESIPTLQLHLIDGLWRYQCTACNREGSCFHFLMETEGVSFSHAVELLLNGDGHHAPASGRIVKQSTVNRLPCPVDLTADDQVVLKQVLAYYHARLKQHPTALDYCARLKIGSEETIIEYMLGFSDRTLGLRLPESNRSAGAEVRNRLKRLGIYRKNGREHFRGCLVIPIRDENETITGVYGCRTDRLKPRASDHLYLPGPHRGIFNARALHGHELIVCASLLDALSFINHGQRAVTSIYGLDGLTGELEQAIVNSPVTALKIAYPHTEAGDNAAATHADRFLDQGIDCFRVTLPKGMTVNEYVRKVDNPAESLSHLVKAAVWLGKGKPVPQTKSPEQRAEPDIIIEPAVQQAMAVPHPEKVPPAEPTQAAPEASPRREPPCGAGTVDATVSPEKVEIDFENRRYRIFGLARNMSFGVLKVNLRLMKDDLYYDDEINLYKARGKDTFIRSAALEVGMDQEVLKPDLGRIVLKLEELQEEQILRAMEPRNKPVVLTEEEREEALALLRNPNLMDRVVADYETCGVVGEKTNVAVGHLVCISRLLQKPLGAIIQSVSAAGKTFLMDAFLSFMPEEVVVRYSALTGQSLFYMGDRDLKGKILAIEEQEGAERIKYSLKLLLSEGKLAIASTGKNPTTGRHEAHDYKVEGPLTPLSSTCLEIDEELQNRVMILTMNETRQQTRAIQRMQSWLKTLEGKKAYHEWERIRRVHKNAQRLLRPIEVINPYGLTLTFLDDKTRMRRDFPKYLNLIEAITLYHQYQRPIKTFRVNGQDHQYIETTLDDIALANRYASEVLGRSLDELPPHTRRFLMVLNDLVRTECERLKKSWSDYRFTRRFLCETTDFSYNQVRVHLDRLVDLEYVIRHRGGRGRLGEYELLYNGEGKDGKLFMIGLIDVDALRSNQETDPMT